MIARRLPALFAALGVAVPVSAADFPPPEKLPSAAELPDPLTTFAGKKVESRADWEATRRPELKALFQHYMYGRYPTVPPKVSGAVLFEDTAAFGGKGTLREVAVTVAEGAPPVHLLIATPNGKGPFPTFVGLNFGGNHTVTDHPKVRLPTEWVRSSGKGVVNNRSTDAGRNTSDSWPLAQIVGRGYAVATAFYGEILPDDAKVRGALCDLLMPVPKGEQPGDATGAIMGWAWGLHRLTDYLVTRPDVDAKKLAVIGHSRLGKTALLAAAFDDRYAVAFPSQAGCGGTGPSRNHNPKAETVKRITTAFPHWFAPHFSRFGDDTTKLPFDQNALVAICAPRPVLFTNATDDQWANPPGQFDVLKAATPVYKLLGVDGLSATDYPAENTLIDSRLGFWVRPGKHAMGPADWDTYLTFADKWLK